MKKSLFNKIDCVRLPVTCLDEGIEFYCNKLGLELLWKTETSAGLKMSQDSSEIVIFTDPMEMEIDFKVDTVKSAIKDFVAAGGSIVKEPFDIRIGKCAVVKDPWNNEYIILDSSKGLLETDSKGNVVGLKKK